MRIEEIFNNCEFIGSLVGTEAVNIKIPIIGSAFNKSTFLYINNIPSQKMNTEIFLRIEKSVNILLNLSSELQENIWEELWDKYIWTCEESEPFEILKTEDVKSANIRYYGIDDLNSLKMVTELSTVDTSINQDDEDEFSQNDVYLNLNFRADWIGDGFMQIKINSDKILNSVLYQ